MVRIRSIVRVGLLGALLAAAVAHANDARFGNPQGWYVSGPGDNAPDFKLTDYEGGADTKVKRRGRASAYLASKVEKPAKHAVVMQSIRSDKYRGKRVRVSAWVKTDKVVGDAGLWVKVTAANGRKTLAKPAIPPLHGTANWRRTEGVLDVPQDSQWILYGLFLEGAGKAWIDDMTWEIVDQPSAAKKFEERLEPSNLTFEPAH